MTLTRANRIVGRRFTCITPRRGGDSISGTFRHRLSTPGNGDATPIPGAATTAPWSPSTAPTKTDAKSNFLTSRNCCKRIPERLFAGGSKDGQKRRSRMPDRTIACWTVAIRVPYHDPPPGTDRVVRGLRLLVRNVDVKP